MTTPQGQHIDRLPAWIKRVTQDLSYSPVYDAVFWNPPKKYVFKSSPPPRPHSVRVYEAHGSPSGVSHAHFSRYFHHRVSRRHVSRIHCQCLASNQKAWLQCYTTHGYHGACILCFVWLSSHKLLCCVE
jgi:hypothetical protein